MFLEKCTCANPDWAAIRNNVRFGGGALPDEVEALAQALIANYWGHYVCAGCQGIRPPDDEEAKADHSVVTMGYSVVTMGTIATLLYEKGLRAS